MPYDCQGKQLSNSKLDDSRGRDVLVLALVPMVAAEGAVFGGFGALSVAAVVVENIAVVVAALASVVYLFQGRK